MQKSRMKGQNVKKCNIEEKEEGRPKRRRQKNDKNEERKLVCNEKIMKRGGE
jgi:hypothetical protein